jgi:hypothetical protein
MSSCQFIFILRNQNKISYSYIYIESVISLSGQKKSRAPKSNKLPDPFPKGEILKDHGKKQWCLGDAIVMI